uniref:60S ribosomal subunit assembly/export protein LOC1 n=1 Tax=Strongyloides venezuelensis TaxID=75913 RepID=A0A0K0F4Z3_STRVS
MSKVKKFVTRVRKSKRNGQEDRKGPKRGTIGKKTKKSKIRAGDPFNVAARQSKLVEMHKINKPISEEELDVQKPPRSFKQMLWAKEKMKEIESKKGNNKKNASMVTEVSEKLGFSKKRHEDDSQLVRRIANEVNREVMEKTILAKYGLAGRSQKELDSDLEKLKAEKQRIKEAKRTLHERRIANLKAKEKKIIKS